MNDSRPAGDIVAFDRFRLDRGQRLLLDGDQIVPLAPKVVDTLLVLVDARGRLVTKEELLSAVWPDTFVEEGSLARNVSTLRKVLGEGSGPDRFIETIPKRGYRFLAEVRTFEPVVAPSEHLPPVVKQAVHRRWTWVALVMALVVIVGTAVWSLAGAGPRAEPVARVRSIAVLPLRNLSDASHEYFPDGITEELITTLAQVHSLRVISRTSVMRYKGDTVPLPQIARELDVDAVIEGAIQQSGDRVRVTVQLVDARTDTHLWAHSFDEPLADVLNVQSAIARLVAAEVQIRLSTQETARLAAARPVNSAAHDEFLRGEAFRWQGDQGLHRALEHYDRAIVLDPGYALAYAALSLTWNLLNEPGALAASRTAAERAAQLDPDLPEAHAALAAVKYRDWDWYAGHAESRRAIEASPGVLDGCFCFVMALSATGQLDEAMEVAKQAVLRNPVAGGAFAAQGMAFFLARRYEEAADSFQRGLEVDPADGTNSILLGYAYQNLGRASEAVTLLEQLPWLKGSPAEIYLAQAYAAAGRRDDALRLVAKLVASPGTAPEALVVSQTFVTLGDTTRGLDWLEKSVDAHEARAQFVLPPVFDPVRDHPRFRALVARLNLPPEFETAEASYRSHTRSTR